MSIAVTFALSAVLLARVVVLEKTHEITWHRIWRDAREDFCFFDGPQCCGRTRSSRWRLSSSNPVVNTLTPVFLIRKFAGNEPVGWRGAVCRFGSGDRARRRPWKRDLPRYITRVPKGRAVISASRPRVSLCAHSQ